MDDKQVVMTRFKASPTQEVQTYQGVITSVNLKPGLIILPPNGEPLLLIRKLGGGGHAQVWEALPLRTIAEMCLPELCARIPESPKDGAILECGPDVAASLSRLVPNEWTLAIKFLGNLQMTPRDREEMTNRLMREARIIGRGKGNPRLPELQMARRSPVPFVAMSVIHGVTLDVYLRNEIQKMAKRIAASTEVPVGQVTGYIPLSVFWRVAEDTSSGVRVLHEQDPPVIHRDVKETNFMVDEQTGFVRLIDMGLAKPHNLLANVIAGIGQRAGRTAETALTTRASPHMFTPGRVAPEMLALPGEQRTSPATDVYLLGCMFYEWLCGEAWVPASLNGEVVGTAMMREVPKFQHPELQSKPKTAARLRILLSRMLRIEQAQRPQSATEVLKGDGTNRGLRQIRQEFYEEVGVPPLPPGA